MYSKIYGHGGDGCVYGSYFYPNPMRPRKSITKTRTAASQIVKMIKKIEAEGLRPLSSLVVPGKLLNLNSDNEKAASADKVEKSNEFHNNGQNEIEGNGGVEKEKEEMHRYNLRSRVKVRKNYMEEGKQRIEVAAKYVKSGRSRLHNPPTRVEDSDHFLHTSGTSSMGGEDYIQPLHIAESVNFDDIGGLSEYIDSLKEMVLYPLLYPEFFQSFHITPPRGVLFCGPPGTGKTLVARALACAASKGDQKVSFYMRKGADVLSKWVGEAEKQLTLLFGEAQRNQPSIIFFDEIDGLAPLRSSKQEQVHNSIVSTLLALMDGLDSRGQVVLIGATNRVDQIDGALRRPGRFDREFHFSLPDCEARAEIFDIHTRKWKRPPSSELKYEIAASCVGFCGADLKALCTEAAIRAFREKYPQVYSSDDKSLIDIDSVTVEKRHFTQAMTIITPAAHRGSIVHSRPLSLVLAPCLQRQLQKAMKYLSDIFPSLAMSSELTKLCNLSHWSAFSLINRPRLLLYGNESTCVDHLGPAILQQLEKFPIHSLALPALLSDPNAKMPEDALVHIFGEARRKTPSVLYIPQFDLWWKYAHDQLRIVLLILLKELPSDSPILLLGTSSVPLAEVEGDPSSVFPLHTVYQVEKPSTEDRSLFWDRTMEAAVSVLLEGRTKSKSSANETFGLTEDVIIHEAEKVKQRFVEHTENYSIPKLLRLHASIMKGIFEMEDGADPKISLSKYLTKFDEF